MMPKMLLQIMTTSLLALTSLMVAAEPVNLPPANVPQTGLSMIWVVANIIYAVLRAQNSHGTIRQFLAFLFGFPGTLISLLLVRQGGEHADGNDVPRRDRPQAGS